MDESYAAAYAEVYRKHWWWRAREVIVLRTLRRYLRGSPPGKILDVGCGDGLLFDKLAEFGAVEGVEPDSTTLSGRYRDQIHSVPFDERFDPGHRFTVVLMLDVLEHLTDPVAALHHAVRLLEPGGLFIATVPAFQLLWTRHDDLNHHVRRYVKRTFRELTKKEPLTMLEERYLFQSLFPAKLCVRASEKLLRLPPRAPSVPPAPLNQLARGWLLAEEALFRTASVPFGSSLLFVARKVGESGTI